VLYGSIQEIPTFDVFRMIGETGKTGVLRASREEQTSRVMFRDGSVLHAENTASRQGFGRKLITAGFITEEQLSRAMDHCASSGEDLGSELVGRSLVTRDQLDWALRQEIEDAVEDLLSWREGEFWFEADEVDENGFDGVIVRTLLQDHARRRDELMRLRQSVPMNATVTLAPGLPDGQQTVTIHSREWPVLALVDGRRSARQILADAGMDELDALRLLHRLIHWGMARCTPATPPRVIDLRSEAHRPPPPPPPPPARASVAD
jgi:Domain of unknown function (DUF4388)